MSASRLFTPLVPRPERPIVLRQVDAIVEQRPQGAVGVAIVVFVDVLVFQVDGRGADAVVLRDAQRAGEAVGALARPAEPQPLVGPERRAQRHRQPALRRVRPGTAHAVGDDEQAAHGWGPGGEVRPHWHKRVRPTAVVPAKAGIPLVVRFELSTRPRHSPGRREEGVQGSFARTGSTLPRHAGLLRHTGESRYPMESCARTFHGIPECAGMTKGCGAGARRGSAPTRHAGESRYAKPSVTARSSPRSHPPPAPPLQGGELQQARRQPWHHRLIRTLTTPRSRVSTAAPPS